MPHAPAPGTVDAPIRLPGRVVLFDYGEVVSLGPDPERFAEIEALAGADPQRLWAAYWDLRLDLDAGRLTTGAYWRAVGDRCGVRLRAPVVAALWSADLRAWLRLDPAVVAVLDRLRAGGTRLALLSNAGADYGSALRHSPLGEYFTDVLVSGELGLVKPDPAVFEHALAVLGTAPGDVLFVDNRADNVEGARAVGLEGHHYEGVPGLEAALLAAARP